MGTGADATDCFHGKGGVLIVAKLYYFEMLLPNYNLNMF